MNEVPVPFEREAPASLAPNLHRNGQDLEKESQNPNGDESVGYAFGLDPQTYPEFVSFSI